MQQAFVGALSPDMQLRYSDRLEKMALLELEDWWISSAHIELGNESCHSF